MGSLEIVECSKRSIDFKKSPSFFLVLLRWKIGMMSFFRVVMLYWDHHVCGCVCLVM